MDEPVRTDNPVDRISMNEPLPPRAVPPRGELFRQDVKATVDHGLGYFLQRVSVDADVVDGKFHGFRIVELRPPAFWQGVDLKPGDVVTGVNGLPIERDIDAYQAFQSLRGAPALRVTFVRAGVQKELVYSIVDEAGKHVTSPAPPSKPAPAETPKAQSRPNGAG